MDFSDIITVPELMDELGIKTHATARKILEATNTGVKKGGTTFYSRSMTRAVLFGQNEKLLTFLGIDEENADA